MAGVTIGDGAVIGARSIVTKNVMPYVIVAGSPAKYIRERFNAWHIMELLDIKWWDWPEEKIKENAHLLNSENIEEFLIKHSR